MKDWQKLCISVGSCFVIALLGSVATTSSIDTWYAGLNKPFINPPNWLFGPVWTVLYLFMGISLYLVWRRGSNKKIKSGLQIFYIQLAVNFLWSFVFFTLQQPWLAFAVIISLWILILKTIIKFHPISPKAAYLLFPYLAWVSFASLLNISIAILN